MRRAAACLLAAHCAFAAAAPAPGTVIVNRATATGTNGGATLAVASNPVSMTVGAAPASAYSAVLAASQTVTTRPGATVLLPHTLTNTGTVSDTYTIAASASNAGGWGFASVQLFADNNNDGQPDSATPLGAVTLAPGATQYFVARYIVPATVPIRTENIVTLTAIATVGTVAPIYDRVILGDFSVPRDCGTVTKMLSRERGPSPAGPVTVTLFYSSCDKARAKLWIGDRLPAGFKYVPGSARWSVTGGLPLSDGIDGADLQGSAPQQIAYEFGATTAGMMNATVYGIPAQSGGSITFDVEVAPGLAVGSSVTNIGDYAFHDGNGAYMGLYQTNPATYYVNGRADFDLTGDRLPTATPGSTVLFNNVLTNRGDLADTYDITLAASTFPPGTTLTLLKSDGVTPLADTDGSGVPDTGVVAPGASYRIVVRAQIPESAPPAAYKVTKVARSAAMPILTRSADDALDTVASKCRVSLDHDNSAQIGFGEHVTYTHYLTNHGNCSEVLTAQAGYLADSRPAWSSRVFVDNRVAGGASLPGIVDASDAAVVPGWNTTLAPGETLRILVDVLAPTVEQFTLAAQGAKDLVDTNLTTLVFTSVSSGPLTARDTTKVGEKGDGPSMPDTIRNYTDSTYGAPTAWAVSGGSLWLKAEAGSCNTTAGGVDTRTVVITGPDGEREEAVARETGPNTGIFTVAALPVRAPPVKAGDGVLQGRPGDVFEIDLIGCGKRIATVVTLMEARSVVFDSRGNEPVAGATVTLVSAAGGRCGTTAVNVGGANPVVTGADGRFVFPPLPAGAYCLDVRAPNGYRFPSQVPWPQLPAGRNLNVSGPTAGGSYGGSFTVAAGGMVAIDMPVDSAAQDGLFVQKEASRAVAELGEFVDYTVRVRNGTGNVLDRAAVTLTDDLPAGFAFVAGSARRGGRSIADPLGGMGPRLTLAIGAMARDEQVTITYRVRLGPGAMQGDGVNRVQARYAANGTQTLSNVATARVQVTGGAFTDKGFILGKVFLDCDANGVQDRGEPGVPGVRLLLEDGTYVITDGAGKFSFYGIANRTHVVKADRTTLPAGARLAAISARHLGDAGSRIVDLKSGEMQRADFAIAGCAAPLVESVKRRIEAAATGDELAAMLGTPLATETRVLTDVKALPASGLVAVAPGAALGSVTAAQFPSPAPGLASRVTAGAAAVVPAAAGTQVPLEQLLPTLDNKLGFVGLADGQTLDYAQATVRVKGTAGATFKLTANGHEVDASRVGKRAVLQDKQLQAWEYIGVELRAGDNELTLAQVDAFGNPRGSVTVRVVAPDRLGMLPLDLPAAGGIADGKTPVRVVVRLTDARGTPVTVRTPVTLEATLGRWKTVDLNPAEPGLQIMVEGGQGEAELLPPLEPGAAQLTVASGPFKAEARLDFLPELRSMIATGVIEGIVNLRNNAGRALTPVRESDGFEQELRHLSREWNDGKTRAGARAAFFLKGKIKGDYLLTAAYDSDKDTKERLFRDIQPDEFYPVYGDSGVRGFDAQSTSRLYVRIDNKRSYLLWGDFTTQVASETRKLTNYSRSLTGAKQHYENDRVSVNAFATRDSTRQVIEELRANGTSGPYQLGVQGALVNSEKVEVITRDRNQPALIVATVAQSRFSDYEVEALTGRILFRAPVPSVDRDLNPVFVRVTYEVDQGGEQFWVAGVDAQVKVTDRVEVGGVYVKDKNPLAPFTLAGANATVKLGEGTYVIGEAARTEHGVDDRKGDAGRIEIKHESPGVKGNAFVAKTDRDFDNPGAYLTQGRSEAGGKLDYKLTPRTTLRAEALRTEDVITHAVRDGAALAVEHQLADRLTLEVGVRHAAEKGVTSAVPAIAAPGGGTLVPQPMPDEVTTVRARLTGSIPAVEGLTLYGEAEVDVRDADRRVLAAGGEYQLPNKGRIYGRHEFVSSITGPYGLNANERQNTTAIGVDTEYMKDGRLFSEYRIRDAMSGGDVEAALGLKNLWSIAPGLRLGTTLERVQSLSGSGQNENTAVALALEYTGSATWKGSTRLEVRDSQATESLLFTVGLAARLARDWTALARNAYTVTRTKETGAEHAIDRMQAGLAWRDSESNRWNALARVEHRTEEDDTQAGIHLKIASTILSMHADWQLSRPFLVSGRYAAKWTSDKSNGLASKYRAQAVGARGTWEFAPRWDVSLVTSALFGDSTASRQYGVGVEVGYLLATNLWVSAGYNVLGYRDADLAGADYTAKGPFVRLRYKFDESLLPHAGEAK
jgi:uncharacterized repeat protein (TIGR01451 family)